MTGPWRLESTVPKLEKFISSGSRLYKQSFNYQPSHVTHGQDSKSKTEIQSKVENG